jgi:hypothetical protein
MHCGTPGRTPPRRPAFVGRLTRLVLLLLVTLAVWAGPASSSPCAPSSGGTRTLAGHVSNAAERECQPSGPFEKRGNADPMSFVFFIGIVVAVLLVPVAVPVAFGRREGMPPE